MLGGRFLCVSIEIAHFVEIMSMVLSACIRVCEIVGPFFCEFSLGATL